MSGIKQQIPVGACGGSRPSRAACQHCSGMVSWIVARNPCTYIDAHASAAVRSQGLLAEWDE
jgi:L-alanine-DL-glutamate epimerase-like enolase superfamily enzyme